MPNITNIYLLRPIELSDDTGKLSLGRAEYTPLKIFLKNQAFDFHQYEIAKTFVLVNNNSLSNSLSSSKICGYVTLMNSEISLNKEQRPQESLSSIKYEAFPSVKIARLAIDKTLQGKGLGRQLLDWCINYVQLGIMPRVGCRFLVVDSKPDAISFYQKSGFALLNTSSHHNNEYPLMFFDLYKASSQ